MPPNLLLVLVALFGFAVHALSTDGGGTVLMYLGAPPRWAIPKGLINPLILLAGLGDAVFQNVQHGLSWDDAATQGVLASLVALTGAVGAQHTLGRDEEGHSLPVTPPKGLVVLLGAGALALVLQACALFTPQNLPATEQFLKDEACIVEHAFVDDATLNTICGLITAEQKAQREQVGRQMKAMHDGACDGGAK
jgi:hypothetical protein